MTTTTFIESIPALNSYRFKGLMYGVSSWDIFIDPVGPNDSTTKATIFVYDKHEKRFYAVQVLFELIRSEDHDSIPLRFVKPNVKYFLKPHRFEIYGAFVEHVQMDASATLLPMEGVKVRQSFTDMALSRAKFVEYWSNKLSIKLSEEKYILHEPEVLGKYYYGQIPLECQGMIMDAILLRSNICGLFTPNDFPSEHEKYLRLRTLRIFRDEYTKVLEDRVSSFRSDSRDRKRDRQKDIAEREKILRLSKVMCERIRRLSLENRRD